jgi:hypothetical protein
MNAPAAQVALSPMLGVVLQVDLSGAVTLLKTPSKPSIDEPLNGVLQAMFFNDRAVLYMNGHVVEETSYGSKLRKDSKWYRWLKAQGFVVRL